MPDKRPIRVLLVEYSDEMVRTVTGQLSGAAGRSFGVSAVRTGEAALKELQQSGSFDLIVMSTDLPDGRGEDCARRIVESGVTLPIVFIGKQKDIRSAVRMMRVGGRDFFSVEEIDAHVFPQTLVTLHEKHQLVTGVEQLEIKRERLEAMQEMVVSVSERISDPLEEMRKLLEELASHPHHEKADRYLTLVRENLVRLADKLEKLRNLKDDKTVKYIKDIKMIDLS